jgi:hypothetical protein
MGFQFFGIDITGRELMFGIDLYRSRMFQARVWYPLKETSNDQRDGRRQSTILKLFDLHLEVLVSRLLTQGKRISIVVHFRFLATSMTRRDRGYTPNFSLLEIRDCDYDSERNLVD